MTFNELPTEMLKHLEPYTNTLEGFLYIRKCQLKELEASGETPCPICSHIAKMLEA